MMATGIKTEFGELELLQIDRMRYGVCGVEHPRCDAQYAVS